MMHGGCSLQELPLERAHLTEPAMRVSINGVTESFLKDHSIEKACGFMSCWVFRKKLLQCLRLVQKCYPREGPS